VTAPLKCGCRPADTFCDTAQELQFSVHLAIASRSLVSSPEHVRKALADIGAAERALRDHLRGEVAA
jgi:hypothetical protein